MTYIHSLETSPGTYKVSQEEMTAFIGSSIEDNTALRKYKALQRDKSILYKYSVLPDFNAACNNPILFNAKDHSPTTTQRMQVYKSEALKLASKVCIQAIQNGQVEKQSITHIIGITCTGVYAPGLEVEILLELGLNENIERHSVNFMGCHAAFHGLRMADLICKANPNATVLVFSVELCSLHFRQNPSDDNILSTYLFGDGAAAAILSSKRPKNKGPYLSCKNFGSILLPQGKNDMKWDLGQNGFEMVLNRNVPNQIVLHMKKTFLDFLSKNNVSKDQITSYAIHPGGKNILKAFAEAIELDNKELVESHAVLLEYGNMSSATILFVLKEMIEKYKYNSENTMVYAAAFGPGLSIESALLEWNLIEN